eukprot:15477941-Alexandrium_andersonii.AAC.1
MALVLSERRRVSEATEARVNAQSTTAEASFLPPTKNLAASPSENPWRSYSVAVVGDEQRGRRCPADNMVLMGLWSSGRRCT